MLSPLWLVRPSVLSGSRYVSNKLALARRKELQHTDFEPNPKHPEEFRVQANRDLWLLHRPTSFKQVLAMYKKELLVPFLLGSLQWALLLFSSFFFFQTIARILSDSTQQQWFAWVIICTMLVCLFLANLLTSLVGFLSVHLASKWKAGLTGLVFRTSQSLKASEDIGLVNTLISNDADRMFGAGQFVIWTATAPLMIIASLALTIVLGGWAAIPSIVWIVLLMISARFLGEFGGKIRSTVLPHTDLRVRLISELISSIFYVKLCCYEDFFSMRIFREREKEVEVEKKRNANFLIKFFFKKLRKSGYVTALSLNLVNFASYFSAVITILILIGKKKKKKFTKKNFFSSKALDSI
jgi:MFS family permease